VQVSQVNIVDTDSSLQALVQQRDDQGCSETTSKPLNFNVRQPDTINSEDT